MIVGVCPCQVITRMGTSRLKLTAQTKVNSMDLKVPVSPGECADKLTILEIKLERITQPEKLKNIQTEYQVLKAAYDQKVVPSPGLTALVQQLKAINQALWQIEDEIRECERRRDFTEAFIHLARSVYQKNDQRSAVKRQINEYLRSAIFEEKSYADYSA